MGLQAVKARRLTLPLPSINPVINLLLLLHLNTSTAHHHTHPAMRCLMLLTSPFYCCLACGFVLQITIALNKFLKVHRDSRSFGWEESEKKSLTVCRIYHTICMSVSFFFSIFCLGGVCMVALRGQMYCKLRK